MRLTIGCVSGSALLVLLRMVPGCRVMTKKRSRPATPRDVPVAQAEVGSGGQVLEQPRPIKDRGWVDNNGVAWRMRGSRLEPKAARKLLRRPDLDVAWAYDARVALVTGAERRDLLSRVEAIMDGAAPPYSHFVLGEFRDDDRRRLLVIEESC